MCIQARIKNLRIQKAITQKELSDYIGVSVVSIQSWESGKKSPSAQAIIDLAKFFNVSADYLLCLAPSNKVELNLTSWAEKKLLDSYRSLDTYGKRAVETICAIEKDRMDSAMDEAGSHKSTSVGAPTRYIPRYYTPSAAGSSVPLDGDDFEMIAVNDSVPYNADFAVKIQGNSMFPYIHDGDTVYVQKDTQIKIGDIGIFCVDGAMYCKQYYQDNGGNLSLVSANPDLKHTNVYIRNDSGHSVVCYGKVLGISAELPEYFIKSTTDNI